MRNINKVAADYRQRGMQVIVLSLREVAVTDPRTGNTYRVTSTGRVVNGRELEGKREAERERVPNWLRQGGPAKNKK